MNNPDKRLIDALRARLKDAVGQATDAEILEKTKGTSLRQQVELDLACQDLVRAIKESPLCLPRLIT